MANFSHHLNSGALISGASATVMLSANMIDAQSAMWLFAVGCFGGLLPDIDSDSSTSMRIIFSVFASFSAILTLHYLGENSPLFSLISLAACCFVFVRFGLKELFERITVHRGTCHSLSFIAMFSLGVVCIYFQVSGDAILSWLTGLFVVIGALTHLILDEIFSVDFSNNTLKKSFGSAFKLVDFSYPIISAAQIMVSVSLVLFFIPEIESTQAVLSNWSTLVLLPDWLLNLL
jgi:hypothetical protein